ncbi:monovalent cation:H+ antiporter, CPA1 (nhx1) [Nowakowskiella sp. JEL0078]|nr:monovalent cation:H+ antiporter, CPA1 (nhx1) [Nowakowskiella sp. JEL0078]
MKQQTSTNKPTPEFVDLLFEREKGFFIKYGLLDSFRDNFLYGDYVWLILGQKSTVFVDLELPEQKLEEYFETVCQPLLVEYPELRKIKTRKSPHIWAPQSTTELNERYFIYKIGSDFEREFVFEAQRRPAEAMSVAETELARYLDYPSALSRHTTLEVGYVDEGRRAFAGDAYVVVMTYGAQEADQAKIASHFERYCSASAAQQRPPLRPPQPALLKVCRPTHPNPNSDVCVCSRLAGVRGDCVFMGNPDSHLAPVLYPLYFLLSAEAQDQIHPRDRRLDFPRSCSAADGLFRSSILLQLASAANHPELGLRHEEGYLLFAKILYISAGMHNLQSSLTFLDCLVFGAILSSTDPVTVLAIFHQNRVDPKLYSIIFGESLLNDSVAIVLFSTLGQFHGKEITILNAIGGIITFISVFTGSFLIGVVIALIGALMLKHSKLHNYPSLESCLISLLAYSSYLLSNGIQLSGIVSLLFCGITLKHYAYDNMSLRSRRTTKYMFRVLSQLSENFIFIYLGVTLFTREGEVYLPYLIAYTLVS